MPLSKEDVEQITEAVGGVVEDKVPHLIERVIEPYFGAIQKDFNNVYAKFDHLENLIDSDYKQRIEKLETQVNELRGLLAVK